MTVKVTNTGDKAAKHSVQLYVSAPYTQGGLEKAAIQLIGYAKTGEAREQSFRDVVLLQPGESEEVTVTFNAHDFYSYDMGYAHDGVQGAWLLEAGDYYFATGNGAHEAVNAVLNAQRAGTSAVLSTTGTARKENLGSAIYLTESNGTVIQNRMTDADLNSWNTDASVTYLSRSDWAGTFPQSIDKLTATEDMIYYLRNATYDARSWRRHYDGPTASPTARTTASRPWISSVWTMTIPCTSRL